MHKAGSQATADRTSSSSTFEFTPPPRYNRGLTYAMKRPPQAVQIRRNMAKQMQVFLRIATRTTSPYAFFRS